MSVTALHMIERDLAVPNALRDATAYTQIGLPAPALQKRLERVHAEYERCDTVVIGIHVRYGGVEFATNAESERVFKHKEERSRLDAFNDQYVWSPDACPSSLVDCCGFDGRPRRRQRPHTKPDSHTTASRG